MHCLDMLTSIFDIKKLHVLFIFLLLVTRKVDTRISAILQMSKISSILNILRLFTHAGGKTCPELLILKPRHFLFYLVFQNILSTYFHQGAHS